MAVDEEKPYPQLEMSAQNGVDLLTVSSDYGPCEDYPVRYEESDPFCRELCQLPRLVSCWECREGALEVPDHRLLHMESF
jgi:hypothetical protein